MQPHRRRGEWLVVAMLLGASCQSGQDAQRTAAIVPSVSHGTVPAPAQATAAVTVVPSANVEPPAASVVVGAPSGMANNDSEGGVPPSRRCVNGFTRPGAGSPLRRWAMDQIRRTPDERFVVTEIRYFVGPEDMQVIEPRRDVERWYVKAYSQKDPKFRHRWLLRRVNVGEGIDATAAYDSIGYAPKTWTAVDDPLTDDPFSDPCTGDAHPGSGCSGYPYVVMGCLDGT